MMQLTYNRKTLRNFGITMWLVLGSITAATFFRKGYVNIPFLIASVLFLLLAIGAPPSLGGLYFLWMKLAYALAWVNTRLILILMFYLIFAPAGLIMRIFGIDLLDRKLDRHSQSYWIKKEKKVYNPADYEHLF